MNETNKPKQLYKAPRGTADYLPAKTGRLRLLENKAAEIFGNAGYRRIITPTFEDTDLFRRSIGESSDIVRKEMYTFLDRAGRSLTLRPEATAPVVRAFIEHNLQSELQPVKLYYAGPMYRYERPQSGRYREFWQLGIEALGSAEPLIDAEVIVLLTKYLRAAGLKQATLHIGSMGDEKCRVDYSRDLKQFLQSRAELMCPDCQERSRTNPLRVFDCKKKTCRQQLTDAPKLIDHLCDDCREHFNQVQELLRAAGVTYTIDPTLVRGFDYYSRTTFEVKSSLLGAQDALGGGGRYDRLVEQYGGPVTPATGFALGVERILLAQERENVSAPDNGGPDVFIAVIGASVRAEAFKILSAVRDAGLTADTDFLSRSVRGQMKLADKMGAKYVVIIGPDELETGELKIRRMDSGEETGIAVDSVADFLHDQIKEEV